MYTLFMSARLNQVDPLAWFADVLARIAEIPQSRLHELLPWHWKAARQAEAERLKAERTESYQDAFAA